MALAINISDKATPDIKVLGEAMFSDSAKAAAGAKVVELVQERFLSLGTNKQGWPSTGFWAGAARSTHYVVQQDGVKISVSQQGVRQRFFGGEIKPVKKKYLTIPAIPEAYGHRAGEFHNLRVLVITRGGQRIPIGLVETKSSQVEFGRKRKDGSRSVKHVSSSLGNRVWFWFARSVNQVANPDVLPGMDAISAAAVSGVRQFMRTYRLGGDT